MTEPAPSGMPTRIGRYQIEGRLGSGATGVVYRAHDTQMDREVALKVVTVDLESNPETRSRLIREAQITSRLQHRNIITVLDMGDEGDQHYIVMELLKGGTLDERMASLELAGVEAKVEVMIQVCDGLAVANEAGVVHRDVKPTNLFLQSDGGLKILDFGIARLATSNTTPGGFIAGTPDYMSPEQALAMEVDGRSDIFSASAVFYWMLTGRKPFEGPDHQTVLRKVRGAEPPPFRDYDAPPALAAIVMHGLRKAPAERYQRCSDMAGDLRRFLTITRASVAPVPKTRAAAGVSSGTPSAPPRPTSWYRKLLGG